MPEAAEIEATFSKLGGRFLLPAGELRARLSRVRALVFDWDGVFNAGAKGEGAPSTFNEADSMGVNLLRYALWRKLGELPLAAVLTGEDNPSARAFALRERFHALYYGAKNKAEAFARLREAHGLDAGDIACVFDDVNDLAMAELCGVRVLVRRGASPLLDGFVARRGLGDYVTAAGPGRGAVREAAELMLGLLGAYETAVESRMRFDAEYARYFSARQSVETELRDFGTDTSGS